jgi:hypothetical protein
MKNLSSTERPALEYAKARGATAAKICQPPITHEPDSCEKQTQNQRERAQDAKQGWAGVRESWRDELVRREVGYGRSLRVHNQK